MPVACVWNGREKAHHRHALGAQDGGITHDATAAPASTPTAKTPTTPLRFADKIASTVMCHLTVGPAA